MCAAGAAAITAAGGFGEGTGGCGADGGSEGAAAGPDKGSCSGVANKGGGTLSPVTTASSMSCW